jgi:hypothetical protein
MAGGRSIQKNMDRKWETKQTFSLLGIILRSDAS